MNHATEWLAITTCHSWMRGCVGIHSFICRRGLSHGKKRDDDVIKTSLYDVMDDVNMWHHLCTSFLVALLGFSFFSLPFFSCALFLKPLALPEYFWGLCILLLVIFFILSIPALSPLYSTSHNPIRKECKALQSWEIMLICVHWHMFSMW